MKQLRNPRVKNPCRRPLRGLYALPLLLLPAGYVTNGASAGGAAIAAAIADPLSILATRSPGARAPGALTQTKGVRRAVAGPVGAVPSERVLSGARSRPVSAPTAIPPAPGVVFEMPAPTPAPVIVPTVVGDLPGVSAGPPVAFVGPAPFIGGGIGGGSGGGGVILPGTGGTDNGGGTVAPGGAPAIPEPATWLMMVIGFMALGVAMRFNHRSANSLQQIPAPSTLAPAR